MLDDKRYTAYCGLYCRDCIPSKADLFEKIRALEKRIFELGLEKYAEHKAKKYSVYRDFPVFMKLLKEMQKLECKLPCREGSYSEASCRQNCEIRKCAIERGLEGCWQCENYKSCELLIPLKEFHPCLENNLDMIKEYGIDNWSDKRGRHYKWS